MDTSEAKFLKNKGLQLTYYGQPVQAVYDGILTWNAAYILVSHGPSGLGGYASGGNRKLPLPGNAAEVANLAPSGPFVAQAASTQGIDPEDANFFDDLIAYSTVEDLIHRAGQGGRSWPTSNVKLDTPTLSGELGHSVSPGDLGTSTVTFTSGTPATITGGDGGGAANLSLGSSGGTEGVGVAGGGSTLISSADGEFVKITFTQKVDQFALTLANFGYNPCSLFGFSLNCFEVLDLTFYNGATSLGTISKFGCNVDGGLAALSVNVTGSLGQQFDAVEIRPQPVFPPFPPYDVTGTEFLISEFKTCAAGVTCTTSLADATTTCP